MNLILSKCFTQECEYSVSLSQIGNEILCVKLCSSFSSSFSSSSSSSNKIFHLHVSSTRIKLEQLLFHLQKSRHIDSCSPGMTWLSESVRGTRRGCRLPLSDLRNRLCMARQASNCLGVVLIGHAKATGRSRLRKELAKFSSK